MPSARVRAGAARIESGKLDQAVGVNQTAPLHGQADPVGGDPVGGPQHGDRRIGPDRGRPPLGRRGHKVNEWYSGPGPVASRVQQFEIAGQLVAEEKALTR